MELVHQFKDMSPNGEVRATLSVERLWDGVYYLERKTPSRNLGDVAPATWSALIGQAIGLGRTMRAKEFQFRTIGSQDPEELIGWMSEAGFAKKHDRVEYRASINELPSDEESPITWSAMESLSAEAFTQVGAWIHQVGVGDPDFDPNDDPVAILKSYLADTELTTGPDCVHLGSIEGQVMSVVIAQVNPKTGWSRITYMGMLPEFRGQGLGKWVHRHGFKMMREQSGRLYQGGTVSTNERMIQLFHEHGCKEYRRMQEWTYKF